MVRISNHSSNSRSMVSSSPDMASNSRSTGSRHRLPRDTGSRLRRHRVMGRVGMGRGRMDKRRLQGMGSKLRLQVTDSVPTMRRHSLRRGIRFLVGR